LVWTIGAVVVGITWGGGEVVFRRRRLVDGGRRLLAALRDRSGG
jgi:hypothetical protein